MLKLLSCLVASSLVLATAPLAAHALGYAFTKIADTNDCVSPAPGGCFVDFGNATITSTGGVVFQATLQSGVTGIFTGNGTLIVERPTTDDGYLEFGLTPVGDQALVVFTAETTADESDLWQQNDVISPPFLLADVDDVAGVVLNGFSELAYRRESSVPSPTGVLGSIEFLGLSGPRTLGEAYFIGFGTQEFTDPSINDSGDVAWTGGETQLISLQTWVTRVSAAGVHTEIARGGSLLGGAPLGLRQIQPSINDAGRVAFIAGLGSAEEGVATGDGTTLAPVVDSSGPYDTFSSVGITDSGFVVFQAQLDTVGEGLYAGPTRPADKIIEIADQPASFSSPVLLLSFVEPGLNDAAQVAFEAELQDGTRGIYRADPLFSVPVIDSLIVDVTIDSLHLEASASSDPNDPISLYEWDLDADGVIDGQAGIGVFDFPAAVYLQLLDPGKNSVLLRVVTQSGFYASTFVAVTLPTACSNGDDDDQDQSVDFPDDTGCTSAVDLSEAPDCSDGIDNDGDGKIDFPKDPGCANAASAREDPQCDDGFDNDGNLVADGNDPGCSSPTDSMEAPVVALPLRAPWLIAAAFVVLGTLFARRRAIDSTW